MVKPIAEFKKVSYKYPTSTNFALANVSLKIRKGEILGIIGPTGAGKTTFCLAFNGIVPQFFGGRFFGSVQITGLDTVEHAISKFSNFIGQVRYKPFFKKHLTIMCF